MKTSFVIIAYNEEKTIGNAIRSILAQDGLKDYEIIVVNDRSTDRTKEVVENLIEDNMTIRLVNNPKNMGRGYSRNKGLSESRGDYIAFVDADIELPKNWIETCFEEIKDYDAVGGIAVPDGDVSYIYRIFDLTPRIVAHTTTISGSNGLFKRLALASVGIDPGMRDGEDVDLSWKLNQNGFRAKSISYLVSLHKEIKSFRPSLTWLYQQGIGANRLFIKYKKIRTPDIAFAAFLIAILLTFFLIRKSPYIVALPLVFCILVSLTHIMTKFEFKANGLIKFSKAVFTHATMILTYFIGRIIGLGVFLDKH